MPTEQERTLTVQCENCGGENTEVGFIATYDVFCHNCNHLTDVKEVRPVAF